MKNPCESCEIELHHCPLFPNLCNSASLYQAQLPEEIAEEKRKHEIREALAARDKELMDKFSSEEFEDKLVRKLCQRNGWELGNADYDLAVQDVKWFIQQLKKNMEESR